LQSLRDDHAVTGTRPAGQHHRVHREHCERHPATTSGGCGSLCGTINQEVAAPSGRSTKTSSVTDAFTAPTTTSTCLDG
jgi:hypothetical protein